MKKMKNKKKVFFGNNRSHAMNATRKKWTGNVQTKKVLIDGKLVRITADARTIRNIIKSNNK